jgi:hypothetical protein
MSRVVEMFGVRTIDGITHYAEASGTEARVMHLIAQRQAKGLEKYGTTVRENPLALRAWLVHQQEELADALVYCTRAIEEIDRNAGDDWK